MKTGQKDNSVIHSAIWACCVLGLAALVGGFWGAEGFRTVGIALAGLFGAGILVLGGWAGMTD